MLTVQNCLQSPVQHSHERVSLPVEDCIHASFEIMRHHGAVDGDLEASARRKSPHEVIDTVALVVVLVADVQVLPHAIDRKL